MHNRHSAILNTVYVLRILFQQVVQWVDEGSAGAEHNEGDEVKVS